MSVDLRDAIGSNLFTQLKHEGHKEATLKSIFLMKREEKSFCEYEKTSFLNEFVFQDEFTSEKAFLGQLA
jgi:hypothetical protein